MSSPHESAADTPTPPREPAERSPRSSLDWARQAGLSQRVIREMDLLAIEARRRRRSRRLAAAGAAALLLLVGTGAWQISSWRPRPPPASSNAVASYPAREELADGSFIEANEGASYTVDYSPQQRRIVLHRGEAHFDVAKAPDRPFVVVAAGLEVRAVGTAFSVQLGNAAVDVLVTEGTVAVETAAAPGPATPAAPLATLEAGHRTSVPLDRAASPPPAVRAVSTAELADRLAWRAPRLEFSGTPLREALALFNRHSAVRLSLADPQLGELKLSGIIRANNLETLLQLLHSDFGLTEARVSDHERVLHRPSANGADR